MKKKQNFNPLQLSFFDEITTHKNYSNDNLLDDNWKIVVDHFETETKSNNNLKTENHERDLSESNNRERPVLHHADERRHGSEIRPSLEGPGTVRHDEGTAAGTIFTDEGIAGINSIPTEGNREVLQPNEAENKEWDDGNGGERDRMAGTNSSRWSGLESLESLMDFKVNYIDIPGIKTKNQKIFPTEDVKYIASISIGESLGERGENRQFEYDSFPTSQEITKDILDTYKEIISNPDYANGDFYEQKLHAIAGGVLASINKSISEEKTIEEPVTNVTNFHSLSAPYENRTFSKKIKYQDNIGALDLLLKLEAEHRSATRKNKQLLQNMLGGED